MKIAFLGLGAIGARMARNLAHHPFELTVWNRTEEKARAFALMHHVVAAKTPREAVYGADIVVTCLPSSREVRELIEGESGIAVAMAPGSLVIDCTSGDPATSREIAALLAEKSVSFADAPVSGGVKGAESGTLTVMCGGDEETVDRARPVLERFGKKIVHCGGVGAGDAVKAMNQALLAIHIWSTGEALAVLARLGVDTHLALDVINGSSGRSNASENLFTERVMDRQFPRTFKLALLDKDVGIAAMIAGENGVPAPFIELAARVFGEAHGLLGEDADHVEAVKIIEERAGILIS